MSKKKRKRTAKTEKILRKEEALQARREFSFFQMARLGLRLISLALFPLADIFQRANLEWLALVLLLGSALVFYEMLDFYRKTRQWRDFFLTFAFYILAFGSLMVAISFHMSWVQSSNIPLQILLTLPRLIGAYYLCRMLHQIYPYR